MEGPRALAALAPKSPLRRLLADPKALTTDDHSDALRILREIREADGQKDEARKIAESQMDLLKCAAVPDARSRMALGYPLTEVAGSLERGAEVAAGGQRPGVAQRVRPALSAGWRTTQAQPPG